jgi:hypothetical protein
MGFHAMKTIIKFVVLTFLFCAASSPCFALRGIEVVPRVRAEKEFGAKIRTESVGTNQVGVWLEFIPKGKLQNFDHVELEITTGGRIIVQADLRNLNQSKENVVVYFSTDPAYLSSSTLTIIVPVDPEYAQGYQFNVKDFIKQETSSRRHLTKAQAIALAKSKLPLSAGESYHVNFTDGTWEVFTEPSGVQVRAWTIVKIRDM